MQEMFKPVLKSNTEMANEITQYLVPIREELETLNKSILDRNRLKRIQMGSPRKLPRPNIMVQQQLNYLKNALNDGNDITTGIRYEARNMMIGDKKNEIRQSR